MKAFSYRRLTRSVVLPLLVLLTLCILGALSPQAMPLASIAHPDGQGDVVGEGDDFATTVLRDPWDMSQSTDVWETLNMPDLQFTSYGTMRFTAGSDSYFWLLFQGYESDHNPGKTGMNYPIDADHYRVLSFRMYSASAGFAYVYWYKGQGVSNYAVTDPISVLSGWHTYVVDLKNIGFHTGGGGTGWYGEMAGLRLHPYLMSGVPSNLVEIDWARLTPHDTSHTMPISWSEVSGSALTLYLDDNASGCDGPAIGVVNSPSASGTFEWGAAVLPNTRAALPYPLPTAIAPGDYYVCGRLDGGTPFYSSGPLTIDEAPMLWFTHPSYLTGPDYASAAGIPWDMNDENAFAWMSNIIWYQYSEGQFHATNITWDPALRFNTPVPLDTSKYRYFSVRMYLEGDETLRYRQGNKGRVARILWYNTPYQPSTTDDIFLQPGWLEFTLDLTQAMLEPGSSPWTASPWSWFRFDPNENVTGSPMTFHIDYVTLTGDPTGKTNSTVPIWYELSEQDDVDVTLYYDTDTNPSNGKTLIGAYHHGAALGDPSPASLEVTKHSSLDEVQAGAPLTYTLRVTNTGSVSLTATITDILPTHVTPTGVLTWATPITAPNSVWMRTVVVTVDVGYSGLLTNVVQVTTDEGASGVYTVTSAVSYTPPNQAPYTPGNPTPEDGASSVPVSQVLSWQGGDPDGDPVTYTVAFGTSDPPPVVGTTTLTSHAPALASGTTYHWCITASDGISTSIGPTWSFTTVVIPPPNQAPYTPGNPTPEDGASSVPVSQVLSWQGGDPDGDPVTYTVAFGTSDPPPVVGTTTLTSHAPALAFNTTYHWRITASDGISTSVGAIWHFTVAEPPEVYLPLVMRNYRYADLPKPSGIQVWWDTTGVPAGSYYILAEVSDGYNTTRWYSEVPIVLTDQ